MRESRRNALYGLGVAALVALAAALVLTSPSEVDRVEAIGSVIKCPVCQGEAIADSPAQMARDMMAIVEERVAAGESDEEIIESLLDSYSGAVLLDPPLRAGTLPLWLAPLGAVLAGVVVIWWWKAHPPRHPGAHPSPPPGGRRIAGAVALLASLAVVVIVAGAALQEGDERAEGVAALAGEDLSQVSDQTMEAVIAANAEHPLIDGMRLAYAERRFEEGDYRSAFPYYLAVAESPAAGEEQVFTALFRMAFMAWDGNGEADAAVRLLDQALEIDSSSSAAMYLRGQILWCGAEEPDEAAQAFTRVLEDESLSPDSRQTVSRDLESVMQGEPCV